MTEPNDPAAESPSTPCPNCGSLQVGAFCLDCGQRQGEVRRSLWTWLEDAAEDLFSLEGRLARTLRVLLFEPGRLTLAWIAGERTRYTPPLRIYVAASVSFFLMLSWMGAEPFAIYEELNAPSREQVQVVAALGGSFPITAQAIAEAYQQLLQGFVTLALVATVPFVALLLKLVLIRARRWYYVDHLIHGLHVVAAALIVWTVAWPLLFTPWSDAIVWGAVVLSLLYGYLSFSTVYGMPLGYNLILYPFVLVFGAAAGGLQIDLLFWARLESRIEGLQNAWTSAYESEAHRWFDLVTQLAAEDQEYRAKAAPLLRVIELAPVTSSIQGPHRQADRAELLLVLEDYEAVVNMQDVGFELTSTKAARAEARARLGNVEEARELYRQVLARRTAVGAWREHGWVLDRHLRQAEAWLAEHGDSVGAAPAPAGMTR